MALTPFFGTSLFDFPFGRGRDPMDVTSLFPSLTSVAPASYQHPLDVVEMNDAYKITVDTPGMTSDDISVTMQDGVLNISGRKKAETEEKDTAGRVLRRERAFTSFSRSFTLPDNIKEDEISAALYNGVLELTVPKVEPPPKPEPKRIAIRAPAIQEEGGAPKITHGQGTTQ